MLPHSGVGVLMDTKPCQIVFPAWNTYVSETDDGPLFVSFDEEAALKDLTDTLEHCARVIIPIRQPNRNGGPVKPESELLWNMEDELCSALAQHGVLCRLVGRLTHQGIRELVFQLDDWQSFRAPVGLWMQAHADYAIDVSEHEGWDFFNDCIRPTPERWLYLADESVVDNLIKNGSDPQKEHALEFVFVGERPGLEATAKALRGRGYRPLRELDFDQGEMVMVKAMKLDVDKIFEESLAHAQTAEEHGVKYDGWGALVVT